MHARRLGTWLAILAITLQAVWPLLVNAGPRAVTLVPLCTVDGVTHYLEVPTGKAPLDDSGGAHHQHCGFCTLSATGLVDSRAGLPLVSDGVAQRAALPVPGLLAREVPLFHGARAPPYPEL